MVGVGKQFLTTFNKSQEGRCYRYFGGPSTVRHQKLVFTCLEPPHVTCSHYIRRLRRSSALQIITIGRVMLRAGVLGCREMNYRTCLEQTSGHQPSCVIVRGGCERHVWQLVTSCWRQTEAAVRTESSKPVTCTKSLTCPVPVSI